MSHEGRDNVDRCGAQIDLLHKTATSGNADIQLVVKSNKKRAAKGKWLINSNGDAAIWIYNKGLQVTEYETDNMGFVLVELAGFVIYSCYSSPNYTKREFENYLQRLGNNIKKYRNKGIICEDERGQISLEWIAEHSLVTDNKGTDPTLLEKKMNPIWISQ